MMGIGRNWTKEETEYLSEHWGYVSVPSLCKALNRSENAIIIRVNRLGLPPFLESGDYITLNQLFIAVTGAKAVSGYAIQSWIKKRDFPVRTKRRNKCTTRIVYLSEFWQWAEKNRSFIDFSKMEPLALGEEPDWVAEQRRKDFRACGLQRKDPWNAADDNNLQMLLKQYKYGYAELSKKLHRTAGAIQRRISDLNLKERPVKADSHTVWTDADFQALAAGIRAGDSYSDIGDIVGRSEKAVRGKVYSVYLTENADKVRAMMGNGPWGHGAPVPTVKQALCLSSHRKNVLASLTQLTSLLVYHRNELGYEPYWQRHMCQNWDNVKGCGAGETNCDECSSFIRIREQYCVRCGATFFERQPNKICARCRKQRKKQSYRKYQKMAQRGKVSIEDDNKAS